MTIIDLTFLLRILQIRVQKRNLQVAGHFQCTILTTGKTHFSSILTQKRIHLRVKAASRGLKSLFSPSFLALPITSNGIKNNVYETTLLSKCMDAGCFPRFRNYSDIGNRRV